MGAAAPAPLLAALLARVAAEAAHAAAHLAEHGHAVFVARKVLAAAAAGDGAAGGDVEDGERGALAPVVGGDGALRRVVGVLVA